MKHILISILILMAVHAAAQEIPAETFRSHMIMIAQNEDIQKQYNVRDEDGERVYYFNLGCYEHFHLEEPAESRAGDVYLWNKGSVFFYKIPYTLDLLRIRDDEENILFYEFVYSTEKGRHYIEAKFVKRYDVWEFVDVAISRVKQAY